MIQWVGSLVWIQLEGSCVALAGLPEVSALTWVGSDSEAWFPVGCSEGNKGPMSLVTSRLLWSHLHGWKGSKNIKRACPTHKRFPSRCLCHIYSCLFGQRKTHMAKIRLSLRAHTEGLWIQTAALLWLFFSQRIYQKIIHWNVAIIILYNRIQFFILFYFLVGH